MSNLIFPLKNNKKKKIYIYFQMSAAISTGGSRVTAFKSTAVFHLRKWTDPFVFNPCHAE